MRAYELPDAAATLALGERLGAGLPLGTVLLLRGDLGAGKTTLTQGIARGLGIADTVSSPTYTLLAEYPGRRGRLVHADLYRLTDADAVESTGLPDLVGRTDSLLVVEWPDRWPDWPDDAVQVTLTAAGTGRHLTLSGPDDLVAGLA